MLQAAWLTLSAADVDSLWNGAVRDYTDGQYESALAGFTAIEEQGSVSPQLYYNIANCYYKLGHFPGKAVLYYERALKLDPSYEDAEVNLNIARESTVDRIDIVPEFILVTWAKAWRDTMSSDAWAYTALALFLIVAVCVLVFRFGSRTALRKGAFAVAVTALIFMVISVAFAFGLRSVQTAGDEAVVTVPVISVKSAPGSGDQSLFILHEGTDVKVVDRLGDWTRIELSDGRQGWTENRNLETI